MPKTTWFKLAFSLILLLGLIIRLLPARNNNFYFTMDQGNDAIHVREIIYRGQILLKGPETGIAGFHHGPLWYYFIGLGYKITGGHPIGSVLMLTITSVAITAFIILKLAKEVGQNAGLLIGASLQFFWWFYDASRYGFNPFPLVPLSILLIFLLSDLAKGNVKSFIWAAAPVGLAFHTESAGGIAFLLLYLGIGLATTIKRKLKPQILAFGLLVFSSFLIPKLLSELESSFAQTKIIIREFQKPSGVFTTEDSVSIFTKVKKIAIEDAKPYEAAAVITVMIIVFALFLSTKPKNQFTREFIYLSLTLVIISAVWFSATSGWQVWHTVYIRPLIFIAILLMLTNIIKVAQTPIKRIALILLAAILLSQFLFFQKRYFKFFKPFDDPSLLVNELAAVDWVYHQSDGQGFYAYSYLPSVYDYPYQYLFWWRGTKKYGYVPCEYSTAPNVPDLFIPGLKYYQDPQKPCSNYRFLIIEPDTRQQLRDAWLNQVREGTILVKVANFGAIRVEKRQQ